MVRVDPIDRGGCVVTVLTPSLRGGEPGRYRYLVVEPDFLRALQLIERRLERGETITNATYFPKSDLPSGVRPGSVLVWN
jgi:hypothetical protein